MGQTSSRNRNVETPSRRNLNSEGGNSQESSSSTLPSTRRRRSTKRRSTVRRSIVNLVKPAFRNDPTDTGGNAVGKRKSWLKSRRWSKAPAEHVASSESEEIGQSGAAAGGAASTILPAITPKETDTAAAATSLAIPISTPLEEQEQQSSHSNPILTQEPLQHSDSIASDAGDPSSISQNREAMEPSLSSKAEVQTEATHIRPDSEPIETQSSFTANIDSPRNHGHEDGSILASPADSETPREITHTEESTPSPQEPVNESESPQSPQQSPSSPQVPRAPTPTPTTNPTLPQNRPFPPPGTLVVVQGVVHTTDVPRPVSTSSSPLSNSFPSNSEPHDAHQTQSQSGSQLQSRSNNDSGLGSRIRRSVSNASRPRSEIGSSARNRLSVLFSGSRPGSIVGGRPSSSTSNMAFDEAPTSDIPASSSSADTSASRLASDTSDSDASVDVNSSSVSSSGSGSSGGTDNESDATVVPEGVSGLNEEQQTPRTRDQSQPTSPQPGMISSSSIDVLGTLLSVAAAATAASLLTGSSDPVLPPPISSPDAAQVTSPLGPGFGADPFSGGVGSVGNIGSFGTGSPGVGASGRADRVRQAWGSIRERLGLRSNSSSVSLGNDLPAEPTGVVTGDRGENVPLLSDIDGRRSEAENPLQRLEPRAARDRMLTEMARAFQLGLGLNGPPIEGEHANGSGPRAEASFGGTDPVGFGIGRTRIGELPPEGSFERFLVDLQTDLRAALGGGPQQQQQRPNEQEQEPEDDEQDVSRRQGDRESDIDELYRLIAEAEAEVRQRQRMIAERQAALRALVSGASAALAGSSSDDTQSPPTPSSSRPSDLDRRARVDTVPDSDEETSASLPMLEDVTDDSDSEDEAPVRNPSVSTSANRETERTESSLSRLSSMFDRQASSARGVNSISEALNRRRAMGIGRTPPALYVAEPVIPSVLTSRLEPVREVLTPSSGPLERATSSTSNTMQVPGSSARVEESPVPDASSTSTDNVMSDAATEAVPPTSPVSEFELSSTTRSQAGSRNMIDDETGRINWWRLYRFPPIAAPPPRAAGQGLGQTRGTNLATEPIHASTSSNPPASPLQDSPPLLPNMASVVQPSTSSFEVPATPSVIDQTIQGENETPSQPTAANTVVPVIVVGLQSVNLAFFGPGAGPPQHNGNDTPAASTTAPPPAPTEDEEEVPSGSSVEQEDATRVNRQRRWQSRAAEAFRTLRHGRSSPPRPPGELVPDMLDGPGSRTFLIYVIGGYYPPDHNIVTGDPDTLDSFEALLDLADLLGQVKPPTASREEIERSGLEVIKAPHVPRYEQEGKISSNCTDRCLICLDDYEAEDDVRVLICKHAFHMNCVDKWLQEGKNNCPACRGAGVTTSS